MIIVYGGRCLWIWMDDEEKEDRKRGRQGERRHHIATDSTPFSFADTESSKNERTRQHNDTPPF